MQTDVTFNSKESGRKHTLFKVDAAVYHNAGMAAASRPTKGGKPYYQSGGRHMGVVQRGTATLNNSMLVEEGRVSRVAGFDQGQEPYSQRNSLPVGPYRTTHPQPLQAAHIVSQERAIEGELGGFSRNQAGLNDNTKSSEPRLIPD